MYSIKDAAKAIGVHPKTIYRWEKAGKFTSHRTLGNQRRFSPYDLESLVNLKSGATLPTSPTPGVEDVHTPGVKFKGLNWKKWPAAFIYTGLIGLLLGLINFTYFYIKDSQSIADPTVQQVNLGADTQISLPSVANFLNGQITIGTDTGDLSFLDQKGNLYVKNSALIQGGLYTPALQLIPSAQPENQLGRQYVDQTTGDLMYYDGLEWVALNKIASASALFAATASGSAEPIPINQPARIATNLYVPKIIDSEANSYFLDPSSSSLSLNLAGDATISSTLTFSKNGEYLTNSVDNYLIFSGGLGIGGITNYGFSPEYKVKAKSAQVDDELVIANLKITTNKIEALNNDGIKLYDNAGYGLFIADGGNVTINGVDLNVPDFAFESDYPLLSPISLEEFIKIHKHLPGVASAEEIKTSGLNLSQIVLQILERVENNVLYILDLNKRLTMLEQKEALVTVLPSPTPSPTPTPAPAPDIPLPDLTEIIKAKIAEMSATPDTPDVEDVHTSGVSSPSANLDLDSINANAGFFKDYLAVIGQATMTDLKINNNLILNRINDGLITLDETGNVIINGNLKVTGAIIASQIKASEDSPIIATFSGELAQFNQLGLLNSGTATISAGTNNLLIKAQNLNPQSQIIVTFASDYSPASQYWVVKDVDKKEFTVFTNYPVNLDSSLNWIIIN